MSHFRRYIVPALESDTVSEVVEEKKEDIVDPSAVVESVVDPAVANPEPVKTEAPEATPAPAADAPATDATADANTPASTGTEPAATETPANAPEVVVEAPAAVPEEPVQPTEQPVAEPAVATPQDTAPAAPVVEAPKEDGESGATDTTQTADESAAAAVQTPAETGDHVNTPESTDNTAEDEISLEELEIELNVGEEVREEAELLQSLTTDPQADDEIEGQLAAVLESLEVLAENTANIIDANQCTEQTAQLIEETASSNLQQVGVELELPAMESYGNDVVFRHKLVLESLDNYSDRIRQMLDVNVAQRIKQLSMTFQLYESKVAKFQQNIQLLREQYKKQKGNWQRKSHEGSLTAVGRFFNVNDGNIMAVLPDDLKMSDYILTQYPQEIMKNFDEMIKIIGSAKYKNGDEFADFVNKMAKIKPQSQVFKLKDNSKIHALLGNAAIIHTVGSLPKVLSYGEHSFPELAEAAKYDAYEQHNAEFIKAILKASNPYILLGSLIIGVPSAIINVVTAHKVELTTDEIGKLIDMADKYAENCMEWSRTISKVINTYQKLDIAMKKFSSIGSEIDGISLGKRYRVWRILGQVKTIVRNQMKYIDTPTFMESFRSFMGAKYTYYLAKRFVATAN